jgi:hypothetical protein
MVGEINHLESAKSSTVFLAMDGKSRPSTRQNLSGRNALCKDTSQKVECAIQITSNETILSPLQSNVSEISCNQKKSLTTPIYPHYG